MFQFTHPVWGATNGEEPSVAFAKFQFTHPVWGATQLVTDSPQGLRVSIHAPRVGCDYRYKINYNTLKRFNSRTPCGVRPYDAEPWSASDAVSIHAPRVGCDRDLIEGDEQLDKFQFTHPVWGATMLGQMLVVTSNGFNSRTPCGGRPVAD